MEHVELVKQALAGDEGARERIFREGVEMVYRITMRYANGDRALAEDLTQKTFLLVFRSLDSFGPPFNLPAWVARLAHNVGLDHVRGRRRERENMEQYAQMAFGRPATPEEEFLGRECLKLVAQVLDAEPDLNTRRTIELFYQDNLSTARIGELQGVSQSVVTTRLARFRGRLKKRLALRALEG